MGAILRELGLEPYVTGAKKTLPVITGTGVTPPVVAADIEEWNTKESKARTRLELAIGDTEMVHILGATTAAEIWDRLCEVKETKGRLGVLATRRALYRATITEGFDMLQHISNLRGYQAELALMGSPVSDEDFCMVIITSLPESWDTFTAAYFGSQNTGTTLKATEFIPIIIDEDRRRRTSRDGFDGTENALQARFRSGGSAGDDDGGNVDNRGASVSGGGWARRECYNCGKQGHVQRNCWAPGGGKEGQGPDGQARSNHATDRANDINSALAVSYMAFGYSMNGNTDTWHLDSGSTYHICPVRTAFSDYTPLEDTTVRGVGYSAAVVEGMGSVTLEFRIGDVTSVHVLTGVIHVPTAVTGILSVSRLTGDGGSADFDKGICTLTDKERKVYGVGMVLQGLYRLDARIVEKEETMKCLDWSAAVEEELYSSVEEEAMQPCDCTF